jgi:hypothetical protein
MNDSGESAYTEGSRRAWINMLQLCLQHLGVNDPVAGHHRWIMERQETIAKLRSICAEYGDDAFDDDLYIPDILEKHLYCYLEPLSDSDVHPVNLEEGDQS